MNTNELLYISSAICPDRPFIIFEGEKWSFQQVRERVNRLANAFQAYGVQKGDRIGMLDVNCPQYIEAYFAAAQTGAIFVPMNFRAKPNELHYLIGKAGVKILFVGSRYVHMVQDFLSDLSLDVSLICTDDKNQGAAFYEDLMKSGPSDEVLTDIGDQDVTVLMYTAGTTGRPKAVPLRHEGFVSYVLENMDPADPESEEKNLLSVPLYHVAGIQALLAGAYGGRSLVLMRQFEARQWLETAQNEKVTRAMLVPTMLQWVMDDPGFHTYDLSSIQTITYGAAPMPLNVIKKAIEVFPWVRFINAFGQTETASTITALGPEDHIIEGTDSEKEKKLLRLASSIGKPLSDVTIKISDPLGHSLPPGEVGDILAKGPRMMSGYWEDEVKSREVITRDGWLRTGDRGWMDDDGYIYLEGRSDDIIIRGGENISPKEVEDVLHTHPQIKEAAVIGVPDPKWGQEPRGIVVPKKGEILKADEIIEYCRSRLAGFKRPRSIFFLDALPRNQMGKVLKKELQTGFGIPEKER